MAEIQSKTEAWIARYALSAAGGCVEATQFTDFDAQAEQLIGFDQEYLQMSRGRFSGRFVSVDLGDDVSVHMEYASQSLSQAMAAPKDYLSLGLVLNDGDSFLVNGQMLDKHSVLIVPPGAEMQMLAPLDGCVLAVCLRKDMLENAAFETMVKLLDRRSSAFVLHAPDYAMRCLRDTMDALDRVRSDSAGLAVGSVLAMSLLVNLNTELALREGVAGFGKTDLRYSVFQAVTSFMRQRAMGSIDYAQLTKLSGLSRRSLQDNFHQLAGCGPFDYFRAIRLHQARLAFGDEARARETIGDIAAQLGFTDWSHFSRIYQAHFGQTPSETRRGHSHH